MSQQHYSMSVVEHSTAIPDLRAEESGPAEEPAVAPGLDEAIRMLSCSG